MFVTVDGIRYKVRFQHAHFNQWPRKFTVDEIKAIIEENYYDAALIEQVDRAQGLFSAWKFNGCTKCLVEDESRNVVAKGYSFCSHKDQFSKKIGRKIAMNRALFSLENE